MFSINCQAFLELIYKNYLNLLLFSLNFIDKCYSFKIFFWYNLILTNQKNKKIGVKFNMINDSQIFIALLIALVSGVLAIRLGTELYQ